jgi:hypothetical protein
MAAAKKMKDIPRQLVNEADRSCLREYLIKRLKSLHRGKKRSNSYELYDAGFSEGAELEIVFLFDELLQEQAPDLRKVRKSN